MKNDQLFFIFLNTVLNLQEHQNFTFRTAAWMFCVPLCLLSNFETIAPRIRQFFLQSSKSSPLITK